MFISFLRSCIFFLFIFTCVTSETQPSSVVRIYSNFAEIIQPLGQLPLEFSTDDWYSIRSDSITLLGDNVNVTSQSITEKTKSLNGAQVYIRSPISTDKTAILFVKAILIDQYRNLVKIQDQSVSTEEALYFTVRSEDIFYTEQPTDSKFYVDFTYTAQNSLPFVSYLRTNLNWQTQYQLNLYNDRSDLIVMVNIRNNGKSSISIDQAELFSGDINLSMQSRQYSYVPMMASAPVSYMRSKNGAFSSDSIGTVSSSGELMGVHVFSIDKPFVIDGQTNYLLPMSRPRVKVERYAFISKTFSEMSTSGQAQRSYRLKFDQYLSQGNCIIRENDRIVGETVLPNLAAKDKHEFSIGQDAEIIYKENITLVTTEEFQEAMTPNSTFMQNRSRYVYRIHVHVKNFKSRSMKIEYAQQFYCNKLELIRSTNDICAQDSTSIKCKLPLNANDEQGYFYKIECIN